MKWIIYILGGLVGLVVLAMGGLWFAGMREGAGKNQGSVEIGRPPAQVWRHMTEPELVKQWATGLVEMTPVSGTPMTPGSKTRMVMEMDGQRTTVDEEMVEVVMGQKIVLKLTEANGVFTEILTYKLEDLNGKTRLSVEASSEYKGFISLLEPIITPAAQKKLEGDLQKLKKQVEAGPAQDPAAAQP